MDDRREADDVEAAISRMRSGTIRDGGIPTTVDAADLGMLLFAYRKREGQLRAANARWANHILRDAMEDLPLLMELEPSLMRRIARAIGVMERLEESKR